MEGSERIRTAAGAIALGFLAVAVAFLWARTRRQQERIDELLARAAAPHAAPSPAPERDRSPAPTTSPASAPVVSPADQWTARIDAHDAAIADLKREIGELHRERSPIRAPEPDADIPHGWTFHPISTPASPTVAAKRNWGPEQAAGPPDTKGAGDIPTAWAPREPDGGRESLVLTYDRPLDIAAVHVYETFNPGAIVRVAAQRTDGTECIIWQGECPRPVAPARQSFDCRERMHADIVIVDLDTSLVPGWNEIDAVEVVDTNGASHWAASASASSTYAER